jgi:hypothetical protein
MPGSVLAPLGLEHVTSIPAHQGVGIVKTMQQRLVGGFGQMVVEELTTVGAD